VDLSRRTILKGAPVLGAAAALPADALGAQGGVGALVDGLRVRWSEGARAFIEGVVGQQADGAPAELRVIGEGVAALDVFKELELLPASTQVRGPVQQLMREVIEAVGTCSLLTASAIEAWLAPGGDAGDPDGRHVRGTLGAFRLGMRSANTRASRKELVERSLADALDDPDPQRLRARARRAARRTRKAEALAQHLASDPDAFARTLTLDPARAAALGLGPGTLALVDDNMEWGERSPPSERTYTPLMLLGMLALGVFTALGFLVAVGGLCVALCGEGGVGILVFLIGAVLVVIGVAGIRGLRAIAQRRQEAAEAEEAAEPLHVCPPCPPCPPTAAPPADELGACRTLPEPVGWVSVPADVGWVLAPAARPDQDQIVFAWGLVQTGRAWPADADGDGVAAGPGAPLPGAPAGALVGRVGDRTFFLGAEGLVPRGLSGPLLLAVNLSPSAAAVARGGVEVQLLQRAVEVGAA
jgi:hypothetical protein